MISPAFYTLEDIMERTQEIGSPSNQTTLSLAQVEFGLDDLRAWWDAFRDICEAYGTAFESDWELLQEFTSQLSDHMSTGVAYAV